MNHLEKGKIFNRFKFSQSKNYKLSIILPCFFHKCHETVTAPCSAENKNQLMDVDLNCQLAILDDLDFETLLNVSQINERISFLASDVLRKKYPTVNHVFIDPVAEYGTTDFENGKWNFSNGSLKINHDFAEEFLKTFGYLIKKLEINFEYIEDHEKIGRLINKYCSETLFELKQLRANRGFLDVMERPFKRVVNISFQIDYLGSDDNNNLKLSELFPESRYVHYEKWWDWKSNLSLIVDHYPNLIDLRISSHSIDYFPGIFQLNPYLRSVTCDNIKSIELLEIVNHYIPELEFLSFSVDNDFDSNNESTVIFENVKDVSIRDNRVSSRVINPEKFNFEKLETLRLGTLFDKWNIGDWMEVILKYRNISKLIMMEGHVNDINVLELSTNLKNLEEARLICNKDIRVESIAQLLTNNIQMKIFTYRVWSGQEEIDETIEQFNRILDHKWDITYKADDNQFHFLRKSRYDIEYVSERFTNHCGR